MSITTEMIWTQKQFSTVNIWRLSLEENECFEWLCSQTSNDTCSLNLSMSPGSIMGKKQPIKVIHVVQGKLNVSSHSSHCTSPSGSCDSSQHQAFKTWLHPRCIYNDPASKTSLSLIIRAVKHLWGQLLYVKDVQEFLQQCMQQL